MSKKTKILTISDTHSKHHQMTDDINEMGKDCEMIIHAGDLSNMGRYGEVDDFLKWYNSLPFKYKICICGNHDWIFETDPTLAKALLMKYPNIIYLENTGIEIEGIKIYGAPQQPEFYNWAFNVKRGAAIKKFWDKIPEDTQVLITHGPPYSYGDDVQATYYNNFDTCAGCKDLLDRINELKELKYSISGHLHEGWGVKKHKDGKDITFINAAMLDDNYLYTHKPIIIEI